MRAQAVASAVSVHGEEVDVQISAPLPNMATMSSALNSSVDAVDAKLANEKPSGLGLSPLATGVASRGGTETDVEAPPPPLHALSMATTRPMRSVGLR